jgi:hypothetical protein
MKAFWIIWKTLPDTISLYAAKSAGEARYAFLLSLRDGFPSATFQEVKVTRAPGYDDAAQKATRPRSLGWNDRTTGEAHGITF